MSMRVIRAGRLLTPTEQIDDAAIVLEGARIAAVGRFADLPLPDQAPIVDARAYTVAPGLIDLHTHGGGGAQAIDGTIQALDALRAFYAAHGVTGFLATIGGSQQHITAGIDAVVAAARRADAPPGATVLGIHLEGPFLNPERPGAFRPESIVAPDPALLEAYLDRAEEQIRLITLAPELAGADAVIQLATARGVVCGAGHTSASYSEMTDAIDRGVRHAIHTFNAMVPFGHRDPGVLGAALTDDRVTAEIIADGIHVHPAAIRLLARAKGPAHTVLITDSVGAAGLPDGQYLFEEQQITVAAGSARLADGTLAGSLLTMDRGVANLVAFGAATLPEALLMGGATPARVLGLQARKGYIRAGADADLFACDDQMTVQWTIAGGELVYERAGDGE